MNKAARRIHLRTQPPSRKKSSTDWNGAASAACSSSNASEYTMLLLQPSGQQPGGLFVEDLHQHPRARGEDTVDEQDGNGDEQTQHGADHGLRNSAGHHLGIAGAEFGDDLESHDHAGD